MQELMPYPRDNITGIVLAGGKGRRMGGVDKGLELLGGRPMAAYAVAALQTQCSQVLLNANRNASAYAQLGCQVFSDQTGNFDGPLAGIASGLAQATTKLVLFAPCDSPLVSAELGPRLYSELESNSADIAVAHDGERLHPVFALMRAELATSAFAYLARGERKIDRWFAEHATIEVQLVDMAESFLNVNRMDEKAALEARLAKP